MQVNDVIGAIVERSGMSDRRMSITLGKTETWTRNTRARRGDPRLSTVADVADVAGCDVVIVDRATGETVATVDPPRRAASE